MISLYASSGPSIGTALELEEYEQKLAMFDNFADSSTFSHHLDQQHNHRAAEINIDDHDQSPPSTTDPTIFKKLNHNASERDRRRKINCLYSSLRSLLPSVDQMKKLSNPATVSRTLRYIPELQSQVEALIKKKEELLSSISRKVNLICQERQKKSSAWRSLSAVSAIRLNDREVVIQISTFKVEETLLSHIVLDLVEDGFSLLNATSHESLGGRIFYTLHLQVERSYIKSGNFIENFLQSYQKKSFY